MKISVSENNKIFKPLNVYGVNALESIITRKTYSAGIFKNNERNSQNFLEAHVVGLDFDGGLLLADAMNLFKEYKHIIATTRNHQKMKNGVVTDRFRVILFLSSPIKDLQTYTNTVKTLLVKYPQADKACKDAARMFYPSGATVSSVPSGRLVDPVLGDFKRQKDHSASVELDVNKKPNGWTNCKWALANGLFEAGEGNEAMMAVASTCKKLNMTKEQAYFTCKNALQLRENRTGASYDKDGLWREVIEVIYADSWNGAVYVCSEENTWLHNYCNSLGVNSCQNIDKAFNFQPINKLLNTSKRVEWLVDGLLTKGGISLIVGKPKSGKSTIIRQLTKSVTRGEEFLGRTVAQGSVLYLALEEQEEMLYEQFTRLGINQNDPIQIHVGGIMAPNAFDQLSDYVLDYKPKLIVIDTLSLFANFKDLNSYGEVNETLTRYRKLARQSGSHIILIHHQNKSAVGGTHSILGSAAIHGSMDCVIIFDNVDNKRYITTSQRGGQPFNFQQVEFNSETESYQIGEYTGDF